MDSASWPEDHAATAPATRSTKIVIAGGFGVGKTTAVGAVSELPPIRTEAWTADAEPVDPLDPGIVQAAAGAMDFGRITIDESLLLYLVGTPGRPYSGPLWDDVCRGAVGALVLVDTRRLDRSFATVSYFEHDSDLPFVVCVNLFDGVLTHDLDDVRRALRLAPAAPIVTCDALSSTSVARALLAVVDHAERTIAVLV